MRRIAARALLLFAIIALGSEPSWAQCPVDPGNCEICSPPRVCNRCTSTRFWDCDPCVNNPFGGQVCNQCTATDVYDCEPCAPNITDPGFLACKSSSIACEAQKGAARTCQSGLAEARAAIERIKGELDAAVRRVD